MQTKEVTILVVDDDEIDVKAIKRAFHKAKIVNPVVVAGNGEEALDILRGENGQTQIARPYLILLDINMPRMGGLSFLKHMRADESISDAIVFILSTSDDDADRLSAYKNHVAGYVLKTQVGKDFMELVGMLDHYWKVVEFPIDREPEGRFQPR